MVNFDFKRLDEEKSYADRKVMPLIRFVANHIDFLPSLCESILNNIKLNSLEATDSINRENRFSQYIQSLEFDDESNYDYVEEFEELFRNAYDLSDYKDEYLEYKKDYEENSNKYKEDNMLNDEEFMQQQLGYIRGRALEILLESFIEKRYTASRERMGNYYLKFGKGCMIKIDGKALVTDRRKTVDIAGWDGKFGEFYEAKVNPENFNEIVLEFLTLVKNKFDELKINAIVGCISMKDKDIMELEIDDIINEKNINYNRNIQLYGTEELQDLLYARPEIIPIA